MSVSKSVTLALTVSASIDNALFKIRERSLTTTVSLVRPVLLSSYMRRNGITPPCDARCSAHPGNSETSDTGLKHPTKLSLTFSFGVFHRIIHSDRI